MAKKPKVNKSKAVRDYLKDHPKALEPEAWLPCRPEWLPLLPKLPLLPMSLHQYQAQTSSVEPGAGAFYQGKRPVTAVRTFTEEVYSGDSPCP